MSSPAIQNPPPASAESKSAKKKKAKAERTESPAPSASPAPEKPISVCDADPSDDSLESPYIRELQKYAHAPLPLPIPHTLLLLALSSVLVAYLIRDSGIFAMSIKKS